MSTALKSEVIFLKMHKGIQGVVSEVKIKKKLHETLKLDIKIILHGDTACGKTSLLGVLLSGNLDDGKGLSRMNMLKNKHEILSGKTEKITLNMIGLDSNGAIINN